MKGGKWLAILAAASLLAGCKGFWDLPAGSSNGGGGGTGNSSGVFYVANQATFQVAAYSIVSGKLTAVSGSPYSLGTSVAPRSLAVSPSANFLYAGTLAGGIFLFSIDSSGALTIGNNGQAISADLAFAMQVDPSGKWLVDAFPNLNGGIQVNAIPITSTGALDLTRTEQIPAAFAGASVNDLVFSPDGGRVFVAAGTNGTIVIPFATTSSAPLNVSSALTIQPLHQGGSALSVAVDPNSSPRLFYVGEVLGNSSGNSGGLRVFNYSSLSGGTLTQAGGSPLDTGGTAPNAILPIASGSYVYVASGKGTSQGVIQGYAITTGGTTAAPTYTLAAAGSSVSAGTLPSGLAEDNQSQYVLEINSGGSPDLAAYTVSSSGTLTSALTSATGTDPVQASAIVALPK